MSGVITAAIIATGGGALIASNNQKAPRYQQMEIPGQSTGVTQLARALEQPADTSPEVTAFRNARRAIQNRADYASSLLPREVSDAVSQRFRFGNASLEAALGTKRQRELDLGTEQANAGYDIQEANLVRDLENRRLNIASTLARGVSLAPTQQMAQMPSQGEIYGQALAGTARTGLEAYNAGQQDDRLKALIAAINAQGGGGGGGYQANQYRMNSQDAYRSTFSDGNLSTH